MALKYAIKFTDLTLGRIWLDLLYLFCYAYCNMANYQQVKVRESFG